jgi:hypothetical protein
MTLPNLKIHFSIERFSNLFPFSSLKLAISTQIARMHAHTNHSEMMHEKISSLEDKILRNDEV